MFREGYSFPHPVLGNEDDISGELNIQMDISRNDQRKIVIENIILNITNPYINNLIVVRKAKCFGKIYCSSTLNTWTFELPQAKVEIHEDEIVNKVELQIFLTATEDIINFNDVSFNAQYNGQTFAINKNDIIGITGKINLPIEKVNEKLGLGNIFKFFHHETEKPIQFEYHHDKIYINYPITKKGEHPPKALFEKKPWMAFNIFIVPALSEALRYIDEEEEEVKSNSWEWFTVLDSIFPESDRTKEYFADAQYILNDPMPLLLAYEEQMK